MVRGTTPEVLHLRADCGENTRSSGPSQVAMRKALRTRDGAVTPMDAMSERVTNPELTWSELGSEANAADSKEEVAVVASYNEDRRRRKRRDRERHRLMEGELWG